MSKIRVYELARELNLTNKVLMDKLQVLGITIGSHMSSLDDEAVQRAKAGIFGKKETGLEQTRVKPTVIRRRRKVSEPLEEPAAEAAPEVLPEEAETPTPSAVETAPEPVAEAPVMGDVEMPAPPEPGWRPRHYSRFAGRRMVECRVPDARSDSDGCDPAAAVRASRGRTLPATAEVVG